MKKIVFIFFCLFLTPGIMAQKCTKELAAMQPSVYENPKGNVYRATEPIVKKNGLEILDLIFASIKDATGLHGFSDIDNSDYGAGGLSAFSCYVYTFNIYCQVGGGFNWKGLHNFEIKCKANSLNDIIDGLRDEYIGIGPNKEVRINNSAVYTYYSLKSKDKIKGYPFYETKEGGGVLVTKPGSRLFKPVSRREYLVLMRKSEEATIGRLKKNLAEFLQSKSAAEKGTELFKSNKEIEDMNNKMIEDAINDLKDIVRFTAVQTEDWMNKPFISHHSFDPPFSHSLASDTDYFLDAPGEGMEWVIINPDYLNKKVPLTTPQFFYLKWGDVRSIAEKKASELLKENFDFDKLQALLAK
ncbi:MAG: hypothetical protein ABI266_10005 [Ginsengibacter sp.]